MTRAVVALATLLWIISSQTFRSTAEGVRVDVLVTEGGRPVSGLRASDFDVRDSNVPQRVDALQFEDVPLRVVLALDVSGSVRDQPLAHLQDAVSAVMGGLEPRDHAALLTFSAEVDLLCNWTADRRELQSAMARVKAGGGTALHDAAYVALNIRDPDPGRPLLLLFSDGQDTASWLGGQAVLDFAARTEAVVYTVTVRSHGPSRTPGFRVDFHSGTQPQIENVAPPALMEPFTTALARQSGGRSISAERPDHVRDAFLSVMAEFRSRYVLTYVPVGVDKAGWHPIEVRLKRTYGKVIARRGYSR